MATIALSILNNRPKADGKYAIKFRITNGNSVAYITSKFSVEKKQWSGGQVVRHPRATDINAILFKQFKEFQACIEEINPSSEVSASQIKEWLEKSVQLNNCTLKDFGEKYIRRLKEEGRTSYAMNMGYTLKYLTECLGENISLRQISPATLQRFERYLREMGSRSTPKKSGTAKGEKRRKPISDTSINIRMTHIKALLNAAVSEGLVEYKIFPFKAYKIPDKSVREIWIDKAELKRLREADFTGPMERRSAIARDLFMLSFYFAGINLTDLLDARLDGDTINFVRKKTAAKKRGEKNISLTVQPEARAIIDKYIVEGGKLDFGYRFRDYGQFRSFITKGLNKIGEKLGFEKRLMFYSARKTFVQFGQQLGVPLYVLEYSIGQTIKEANSRPIFDYLKVMRFQSDLAIRAIIDYALGDGDDDEMPIPEWARNIIRQN